MAVRSLESKQWTKTHPALKRTESLQVVKRERTEGPRNQDSHRAQAAAVESPLFIHQVHHPNIEMLMSKLITRTWKNEAIGR
jgi:hypothetical protein